MRGNVHICKSDKFVPVLLHMNFFFTLAYEPGNVIVPFPGSYARVRVKFICKSTCSYARVDGSYARVEQLLLHMNYSTHCYSCM